MNTQEKREGQIGLSWEKKMGGKSEANVIRQVGGVLKALRPEAGKRKLSSITKKITRRNREAG